jgi:hypothetical protein
MDAEIAHMTAMLRAARELSGQSNFRRRWPGLQAASIAQSVAEEARRYLAAKPEDRDALKILADACELRMDFFEAAVAIDKLLALSEERPKKLLSQLARVREAITFWRDLSLSPEELAELGAHISERVQRTRVNSTAITDAWLKQRGKDVDDVLGRLRSLGGLDDLTIMANVA